MSAFKWSQMLFKPSTTPLHTPTHTLTSSLSHSHTNTRTHKPCFNHASFLPIGLALAPAFPTMVDNHVSHNSGMAYMGAMEPKPVYQPSQVTPSRYSPVPRHMLGEEDFTRSVTRSSSLPSRPWVPPLLLRCYLVCLHEEIYSRRKVFG